MIGENSMKKILVIGSLNLDMTVQVDHTPVVGETILSNKMEMNAGGKELTLLFMSRPRLTVRDFSVHYSGLQFHC